MYMKIYQVLTVLFYMSYILLIYFERCCGLLNMNNETIENTQVKIPAITIRKSIAPLIFRLVANELLFEGIYLGWRFILDLLPVTLETYLLLNFITLILFLVLITILQTGILVWLLLSWANDYYEIRPVELVHKQGILSKRADTYSYSHIQTIKINQGLLGRIFNYGGVEIYIPTLGYNLNFNEIPNPTEFVELIKNANPEIKEGAFLLRSRN